MKAHFLTMIFVLGVLAIPFDGIPGDPFIEQVEGELSELDKLLAQTIFMKKVERMTEQELTRLIRLNPREAQPFVNKHWATKAKICETEATWRTRFVALEGKVKARYGRPFPRWFTENREWQKLDVAMKQDGVRVKPEECARIYADPPNLIK